MYLSFKKHCVQPAAKKSILLLLILSCFLVPFAQQLNWKDTIEVKKQIDGFLRTKKNLSELDSLFKIAANTCHRAGLKLWELRILNFWSQVNVSYNEIETSNQLIQEAIHLCENDKAIISTVDYRDAILQVIQVYTYKGNFDSSVYWCQKVKQLARNAGDLFNESLATSYEAINLGLKKNNIETVDSLFKKAILLSLQTTTRHDDAMALHNYAVFQREFPVQNIKASLETLLSIQDFAADEELKTNTAIPYRRAPFFYRGTHIMMLQELALGYFYLGDFEQAISYSDQSGKKNNSEKRSASLTYTLLQQAFFETYRNDEKRVQLLYDSAVKIIDSYSKKKDVPISFLFYVRGWLAEQKFIWKEAIKNYRQATLYSEGEITENQIAQFRVFVKAKDAVSADSIYNAINASIHLNSIQYYRVFFYKELPAYYRLKNDEIKALQANLVYYQLKDSMAGLSSYLITSQLEKQFKTKEKDKLLVIAEKERIMNQKQLALRNKQTMILAAGIFLLALTTALYVRNYNLKKKQAVVLEQKNNHIEILIRELHHRVKNNLQVVSGLLSLQSNRMEDDTARLAMDEGRNRVDAMAMIHQKLYMDKNLAGVDIKDYLENLTASLAGSFGYTHQQIETSVNLQQPSMDIDMAIPIGLIVNELVTNAFKHAFGNTQHPKINVSLDHTDDGIMELKVFDNGSGIAINDVSSKSFGMKLVHTLVTQLNGTMQQQHHNGTIYSIQIRA